MQGQGKKAGETRRFLDAGKILRPQGLRAEVKIQPYVDSAEFLRTFPALYLDGRPLELVSSRVHKGCLIAKLKGIDTLEDAEALRNRVVQIDREDADLPEGSFFLDDLIGCRAVDEAGRELGILEEIWEKPAQRIYVIRREGKELLIPAIPAFILRTDPAAGILTVRLIEGME